MLRKSRPRITSFVETHTHTPNIGAIKYNLDQTKVIVLNETEVNNNKFQ